MEADEFIYFRKGEWAGIIDSISFAEQFIIENPEWIIASIAFYPPAKELITDVAKVTDIFVDDVKKIIKTHPKHVRDSEREILNYNNASSQALTIRHKR